MAKIKYSEDQEPLTKKHYGYTFIKNSVNYSMFPAQRNKRTRTTRQLDKMQNLQKAVRFWRTMSPATKASWETFAATYPQPSKRVTGIPLTGYQLFIKRNHYCFLNAGLMSDFMELPELVSLPNGAPIFTLQAGLNSIDLTEIYIKNFGFIPSPGQWLIFAAVPYSEISGQFFPVIYQSIQVLETYIDGFFLNIEMPTIQPNIVYSVYLSKPVNPGQSHKSSKIRYMGCFTTKSFLGLSDTPSSYAGQAGKVVMVNEHENALEFSTGGGGGLTCEDLPNCPTIISIQDSIDVLYQLLIDLNFVSIPPVNYGLLYNGYVISDAGLEIISSSDSWVVCSAAQYASMLQFLGCTVTFDGSNYIVSNSIPAGRALKQIGFQYWLNDFGTNSSKFSASGSGSRTTVNYNNIRTYSIIRSSTPRTTQHFCIYIKTTDSELQIIPSPKSSGLPLRLCNPNTTLQNGEKGYYTGNNGRVYRTICINTVEFLADNLAETKWRSGNLIPEITVQATWNTTTTPALCAYNNDWNNV